MTKFIMKVFNARQMVGKFAKGAMLAACFGMMMSISGVANADKAVEVRNARGVVVGYLQASDNFKISNSKALELADNITVSGKITGVGIDSSNEKIENVANGSIATNSKDAVNGGQIYTMTNVESTGNYIAAGTGVASNLSALDTQVKANTDALEAKADKATTLAGYGITDAYTKTETDTALGNKADKATTLAGYGITDAVTKTELEGKADKNDLTAETNARIDADKDLQKQIDAVNSGASAGLNELNNKINQTNDRVDRVGATAAALAAINYQPMAKGQSQVAVGMGGYKGKKATAIGMAYQISDRISGSVAGAANGSERMFNVGFNYLFGQHSDKDVAQCASVPGSVSLKEAELQAQVDSMKNEIAELKALIKALAAK